MDLVLLEVIEKNRWSVNLINVLPVVLKSNAMHVCHLHAYTVVIFLSLLWSVLSFINASAHCDDSCAQLKWSYHFSSFVYKGMVYISCVIDYIPGRSCD